MNVAPTKAATGADWQAEFWRRQPAFACIADVAERRCAWPDWPAERDYYRQLSHDAPVRFVAGAGADYEDHIARTGEVPTRYRNWHDLLNALIWHRFPASKLALNRLHCQAKAQAQSDGTRGRRRDAATLFDESGAIIWSDDPSLLLLVRQMDWTRLFLQQRAAFAGRLQVLLFGHGLLEKMRQPFIGLTAHALLLHTPALLPAAAMDCKLASVVEQLGQRWSPAELAPLPVLGVPGWWPENGNPAFYENRDYFRRQRSRQSVPDQPFRNVD